MTTTPLLGNSFFGLDVSQLGTQLLSLRRRLSKRLLLLEFSASGLRFAEASPSMDGVRFSHVSRVSLPDEALERGVPSDPAMMASLVQALCQEKGIPAHRAAVVLSPDVAYQRVVTLPADLTLEQARCYLRDPANAVPLPFPLEQTDFDLYPLAHHHGSKSQSYLLIAVPQALIDRVISLLDNAGFELQALELGPFSVFRFLADELISLRDSELHLVLELLPDCSQLSVMSSSGPTRFERLSAIRDFPCPDLDDDQRREAMDAGVSAEEITLKDDRYLPISELDLRAVLHDVRAVISDLNGQVDSKVVSGLSLSGINSAHPLIKCLFQEALGFDVKVLNPVLMPRVSGFSTDDLLVQAGLTRLIGLGLGLLPREQLLSCHRSETSSSTLSSPPQSLAVDAIIDSQEDPTSSVLAPLDVEVNQLSSVGLTKIDPDHLLINPSGEIQEESVVEEGINPGEEESPSLGLEVKEKAAKPEEESVVEEGMNPGEEEWPSLGLEVKEEAAKPEEESVVEEGMNRGEEEEWPKIKAISGLDVSLPKSTPVKDQSISQSRRAVDDSSESSSLGELRFQDE